MTRSTSHKGHTIDLEPDPRGVVVATIRHGSRHCLTIRGSFEEAVAGAALDAVTAAHNGASWSALATQTGPRGRLIRELEP